MKKDKKIIYLVILIMLVIIYVLYKNFTKDNYELTDLENDVVSSNEENTGNIEEKTNNKIVVHIAGCIQKEGIYEMPENSRINDCIQLAGGLTEEADITNINLAEVIEDGIKIYIPQKGENSTQIGDNDIQKSKNDLNMNAGTNLKLNEKNIVNINTASQTELETLPGIGPSIALKIVDYRYQNGKFKSIEDIKKVSGIGDSKFYKIKDLIKV